jgi:hypothetical protein
MIGSIYCNNAVNNALLKINNDPDPTNKIYIFQK